MASNPLVDGPALHGKGHWLVTDGWLPDEHIPPGRFRVQGVDFEVLRETYANRWGQATLAVSAPIVAPNNAAIRRIE